MLRHKSTPCLLQMAKHSTTTTTTMINHNHQMYYGNDNELKNRYDNLQEQHQQLKREINDAREQIKRLNTRMSRLLMEKKRILKNFKPELEITMEEKMFELEQQLRQQQQQNERLRERLKLMYHSTIDDQQLQQQHRPKSSINHQSSMMAKKQPLRNTKSAYSNVRSRIDSGLGFYFRPLNLSRSSKMVTNSSRRSRSQNDRSVTFKEPTEEEEVEEEEQSSMEKDLTLKNAIILIQDAKEEIIRLESIIEQQQNSIDSLRKNNPLVNENGSSKNIDTDESMLSMMIMTATRTTTTATRTTTTATNDKSSPTTMNLNVDNVDDDQTAIDSLWLKYQQILNNKKSFQRISLECQQIFEKLYSIMKLERQKSQEYRLKLQQQEKKIMVNLKMIESARTAEQTSAIMLMEKDKIIENLRKENQILQDSLKQCMNQLISIQNNDAGNMADNHQQQMSITIREQIQQIWYHKRNDYEKQINELNEKIGELNDNLYRQQQKNESLRIGYENLQQLNENDQLKIVHLEQKVCRLSDILFHDFDHKIIIDSPSTSNHLNNHHDDTSFANGSNNIPDAHDDDEFVYDSK
ncbi:uncharacterized protein LOC113796922 [Dermatophagoides pteronyssinus]|uniref:uncharacterized protein LOC113796922 n=1 Tax=Dermatophagoides pteronyssinus TaxID=6956 RepID=UPI003F6622B9